MLLVRNKTAFFIMMFILISAAFAEPSYDQLWLLAGGCFL